MFIISEVNSTHQQRSEIPTRKMFLVFVGINANTEGYNLQHFRVKPGGFLHSCCRAWTCHASCGKSCEQANRRDLWKMRHQAEQQQKVSHEMKGQDMPRPEGIVKRVRQIVRLWLRRLVEIPSRGDVAGTSEHLCIRSWCSYHLGIHCLALSIASMIQAARRECLYHRSCARHSREFWILPFRGLRAPCCQEEHRQALHSFV